MINRAIPLLSIIAILIINVSGAHTLVPEPIKTTGADSTQVLVQDAQGTDSTSQAQTEPSDSVKVSQPVETPATPEVYTPAQNMAYQEAIEIEMAPNVRLKLAIQETIMEWQLSIAEEPDEWDQILANLNIPRAQLQPSGREQVFRQYAMNQAKDVDSPVPTSPGFKGLEIPLSDIGQFLGLTEDVSPTITYDVTFATNVAVVIYGADARKVADLQRPRFQRPGKYVLTWNLKDNNGRPMPAGDYIAEVQIGLDALNTTHIHVVRKKIVIR